MLNNICVVTGFCSQQTSTEIVEFSAQNPSPLGYYPILSHLLNIQDYPIISN